jgi:hypothetical protein
LIGEVDGRRRALPLAAASFTLAVGSDTLAATTTLGHSALLILRWREGPKIKIAALQLVKLDGD